MRGVKPKGIISGSGTVTGTQKAPSWLSTAAKAEWRRTMPHLVQRRTLTEADLGSFENYCVAIGQVRECEATLRKRGMFIETDKGTRAHPAVRIQADAMTRARLLAAELGLTPVSRSRPSIRDDNPSEDSDEFPGLDI